MPTFHSEQTKYIEPSAFYSAPSGTLRGGRGGILAPTSMKNSETRKPKGGRVNRQILKPDTKRAKVTASGLLKEGYRGSGCSILLNEQRISLTAQLDCMPVITSGGLNCVPDAGPLVTVPADR